MPGTLAPGLHIKLKPGPGVSHTHAKARQFFGGIRAVWSLTWPLAVVILMADVDPLCARSLLLYHLAVGVWVEYRLKVLKNPPAVN